MMFPTAVKIAIYVDGGVGHEFTAEWLEPARIPSEAMVDKMTPPKAKTPDSGPNRSCETERAAKPCWCKLTCTSSPYQKTA